MIGAVASSTSHATRDAWLALRFHDDNPHARASGLSPAAMGELRDAAGLDLLPRGRAPDGAFLFAVAMPPDGATLRQSLNRLRATGALVYADVVAQGKRATTGSEAGRSLLVVPHPDAKASVKAGVRVSLAAKLRMEVSDAELVGGFAQRYALPRVLDAADAATLVAEIAGHDGVVHVELERRALPQAAPTDPMFALQWNLNDATGGINAPGAWAVTTGDAGAPIAILDTGTLPHPDLAGRVVGGYDMIAEPAFAGDGDGRDPDPTDPGDFVGDAESRDPAGPLFQCAATNSTWHGTMIAGALGAAADNGLGVTPVDWRSPILSVRVMGKCGGALADVADGIRWAAGLPVTGVPLNTRPARVINLSMTGEGACGPILQGAVTDALARGAVVVAAAGNHNADVADRWPANCNGVIAVAATSRNGARAFYSNGGERISLSAPGGGFGGSIPVLRNAGTTTADPSGYGTGMQVGTSLAAPHVAGTVALMRAVAPALDPAELQALVETSARTFPAVTQDPCSTATCGAGIVDAAAAVQRAKGGLGALPGPPPSGPVPVIPPLPPATVPPPAPLPPGAQPDPPPTAMPFPEGWSAKDPAELARLEKISRPAR